MDKEVKSIYFQKDRNFIEDFNSTNKAVQLVGCLSTQMHSIDTSHILIWVIVSHEV